ncbi:hypothetical protein LDENG_00108100 [Lucifuga dentata]|nr:hypothetical protein LDENG_00108100 [Lucifuga dentata]
MLNLTFRLYFLLFSCIRILIVANSTHLPRMVFTVRETTIIKSLLAGHNTAIWVLPEGQPDVIRAAGKRQLYTFSSQNLHKAPVERTVLWKECVDYGVPSEACQYNITVLHKRAEADELFLCGSDSRETVCCNLDMSKQLSVCSSPEYVENIKSSFAKLILKEREPSVLVESAGHTHLYMSYSGSSSSVGIHKFGKNRVTPGFNGIEQHYVGMVISRREEDSLQDKVFAFYKEKNTDKALDSRMWVPYVSQVCLADVGGPKLYLQFSWTSEMKARLFCGDFLSRQHYSELVDVTAVYAEQWRHTRVYALFRNEWGMTAVCTYTIEEIEAIFKTSRFKEESRDSSKRGRVCVADSTKVPLEVLKMVAENSEMEEWVKQPLSNSAPLLVSHHHYTHICVDSFQFKNYQRTVFFLSLQNGAVHKLMENKTQFVIAEYWPFAHRAQILSMTLHPSTRKLYVSSSSEVVQVDVGNCDRYGDRCEECILARDPYCGWNGTHCSSNTSGSLQDVEGGKHSICMSKPSPTQNASTSSSAENITLPLQSKYFLRCAMSSLHAKYTWYHNETAMQCSAEQQQQQQQHECLLLIDSMIPQQAGTYRFYNC